MKRITTVAELARFRQRVGVQGGEHELIGADAAVASDPCRLGIDNAISM
jgi:hypothetical protein